MANVISYVLDVQDRVSPALDRIRRGASSFNMPFRMNIPFDLLKRQFFDMVTEFSSFETQLTNVVKVLDNSFTNSQSKVAGLGIDLIRIGRDIPITTDEIMGIAAGAAKAGISEEYLADFTKATSIISKAFEISPEMAGNKFAKIISALDLDPTTDNLRRIGGMMNEVANNMRVSAKEIVRSFGESVYRLSGALLSEEQMIALNAAGLAAGVIPSRVAQVLSYYGNVLGSAAMTKKGREALGHMGISKQRWEELEVDPIQKNEVFLRSLRKMYEDKIAGKKGASYLFETVLNSFFGKYRARDMEAIIANMEEYDKAMALVSDSTKVDTSLKGELDQVSKDLDARVKILKNSFTELRAEIGYRFSPMLKGLTDWLSEKVQSLSDRLQNVRERKEIIKERMDNRSWFQVLGDRVYRGFETIKGTMAGYLTAAAVVKGLTAVGAIATGGALPAVLAIGATAGGAYYKYAKSGLEIQEKYAYPTLEELSAKSADLGAPSVFIEDNYQKLKEINFSGQLPDMSFIKKQTENPGQNNLPINLKIEGDLKVPEGYGVDLRYSVDNPRRPNSNFNFTETMGSLGGFYGR